MQQLRSLHNVRSHILVAVLSFFLGFFVNNYFWTSVRVLVPSVTAGGGQLGVELSSLRLPTTAAAASTSITAPSATASVGKGLACKAENATSAAILNEAVRRLVRAHRYLRNNARSLAELQSAIKLFAGLASLQASEETQAATIEEEVCPEEWKLMKYGYPYYFSGYVLESTCPNVKPLSSLVTIALNGLQLAPSKLDDLLRGVRKVYPDVPVLVAAQTGTQISSVPNLTVLNLKTSDTEGHVWKKLAEATKTKYVFIGRQLYGLFTNDTKLERLIRATNRMAATVVGGAHRNESGHWSLGCYQTAMRNYAFRLVDGYDFSSDTCAVCDYLSGPFLAKAELLVKAFDETMSGESLFLDLFSQLRKIDESATFVDCADSMSFTEAIRLSDQSDRQVFAPFAKKWKLNRIILPNQAGVHKYSCSEAAVDCSWSKAGIAMPLCCLDEITSALLTLMDMCKAHDVRCELEGGTVVGAYKFQGQLPWERDFDINWHSRDYWKMLNTTSDFKSKNLYLSENSGAKTMDKMPECWRETNMTDHDVNCGYFALRTQHWRGELWGAVYLAHDAYELQHGKLNATLTLLDGRWVRTYPNPVSYARNLYGGDLLGHIEHWITLGLTDGWIAYPNSSFLACPTKGFHGCLDQFLPTGNLQFMDVWV